MTRDMTEIEKQHELQILMRRFESKIEQEKLLNQDLQDSLRREQQRIHEQERRADSDKKMIESLQTQLAQARYAHKVAIHLHRFFMKFIWRYTLCFQMSRFLDEFCNYLNRT